jgi:TctA family transporter
MTISGADPAIFVKSGISISLIALSVISIAAPFVLSRIKGWKGSESEV